MSFAPKFPVVDELTDDIHCEIVNDSESTSLTGKRKKREWFKSKYGDEKQLRNVKQKTICKFYSTSGKCKNGESCHFSHDLDVSEISKIDQPCRFLYTNEARCPKGELCHFSHDLSRYKCPFKFAYESSSCGINCSFDHRDFENESSRMDFVRTYHSLLNSESTKTKREWQFYLADLSNDDCLLRITRKTSANLFNVQIGAIPKLR
jgi:hypothetical protein